MKGRKDDTGKPRWDLLPWAEVEQVVKVLTFGAVEYGDYNWQKVVAEKPSRYFAALHRHVVAWRKGEKNDPKSGKSHLAHAVCCLLFLMWHDRNDRPSENTDRGKE